MLLRRPSQRITKVSEQEANMAGCSGYTIRQGRREDMSHLLSLLEQGKNLTLDLLHFHYDIFPPGVFVAETLTGEIISHCSAVPLDDSTGFITFYSTKKLWRGKGIGKKVFNLSCKALGKRQLGLNCLVELQEMYTSIGFVPTLSLFAYTCLVKDLVFGQQDFPNETIKLLDIKDIGVERILTYDQKIHPMDRRQTLMWYIEHAHVNVVIVENDKVIGWGSLYKVQTALRFMPLYADSPKLARALAHELLKRAVKTVPSGSVFGFPVDNNIEAEKLFVELGMTRIKEIKRMFTEHDVPIPNQLIYSILNFHNVLA